MDTLQRVYDLYRNGAGICTDSRKLQQGDIFFALKGPSFNGNSFAANALKEGAIAAIVDDKTLAIGEHYFLVPDVLAFLQQLATYHRQQLNIPVVAIAGSNGKTTTKELCKAVLQNSLECFATPGNFNNEIGVPLALLMMKPSTEVAIIEMGARKKGDIAELCDIALPTHGIVTNTGKDHLETFGTLENTRKTNAELFEYLSMNDGIALVSSKQDDLLKEAEIVPQVVTYGSLGSDVSGSVASSFPFVKVTYQSGNEEVDVRSNLVGKYNFENIMAAVAVGKQFNVPDALIKKGIEEYKPSNNRSQLLKVDSNTFIMDAYNANPSSMLEALNSFDELEGNHKVVILGDMLELGAASEEEHLLIALRLKQMQLDNIILVGPEFGKVASKLNCQHFNQVEDARPWFASQHYIDTLFLLKGSRGIALEKIL